MNVSVAENENTYTSITTAAWSHPWPRRRCSVSLCLVWEWFDEKTDNTHVQCLSLQFLFFVDEQKYIYRMIFVHSLHLYTVILLPIYIQYICSLKISICYLWMSHSCNSKYNLFLLSTSTVKSCYAFSSTGPFSWTTVLVPGYKQRSGINSTISACPTQQREVVIRSRIAC